MRTKQYISTIDYNTDTFLKYKLDEWLESKVIDFYAFIKHKKECDEKKDHKHLLVFPNRQIDTNDFNVYLSESCKDSDKPLGTCGIWHTVGKNNVSDWILYVLHDPVYLKYKGITDRVYAYSDSEFVTSHRDGLDELIFDAYHTSKFYFDKEIRDKILNSENPYQTGINLLKDGYIPMVNSCSYHHFLQMIN